MSTQDVDATGPAAYDDANRAFLQSLFARGTVTLEEGKDLVAAILSVRDGRVIGPDQVTSTMFKTFLDAAARALSPFDYEIRSTKHQTTGVTIWAVVNSASDALTQLATAHAPEEMAFFKRLLDAMFETYNTKNREVMAITSLQALKGPIIKGSGGGARESGIGVEGDATQQTQLATQPTTDKGLTRDQAEKALQSFVHEGWLERNKDGYHSLSARALLELRGWLVDTYNDVADDEADENVDNDGTGHKPWQRIKFCEACRAIVTTGVRCAERECPVRLHTICQAAFWNSRPQRTCPRCSTGWDERGWHYVGPKAATKADDALREKRRSGTGVVARGGREEQADAQDDRSEDEAEDEDE